MDPLSEQPRHPPATEGLGPLDRDRASSLADEGGVSAAAFEARESRGREHKDRIWRFGAAAASLIVFGSVWRWRRPAPRG